MTAKEFKELLKDVPDDATVECLTIQTADDLLPSDICLARYVPEKNSVYITPEYISLYDADLDDIINDDEDDFNGEE